jgi:hypothetical protein
MRGFVGVLTVCVVAALPATADAATWKGKTRQGRAVVVRTDAGGVVNRVRIGWKANCAKGAWYKSRTLFLPPLDSATATSFAHVANYRGHPEGFKSRIWVRVAGTLDNDVWSGTFRVRVRVSKNGELVDTCRLKGLRWRARPVS